MKRVKEIAASGYRTGRTSRAGRTNGEMVSHNGFCGFTQRISSFHTTDLAVSHNGFHGIQLPISR